MPCWSLVAHVLNGLGGQFAIQYSNINSKLHEAKIRVQKWFNHGFKNPNIECHFLTMIIIQEKGSDFMESTIFYSAMFGSQKI